jgi:site-specific recombinase XerD
MKAYKTSQGNWQLNFSIEGVQKTLYLGKRYNETSSFRVSELVTELVDIRNRCETIPLDVSNRVKRLPLRLQESLRRFGLVGMVSDMTLEKFFEKFLETKKDTKPKTQKFYRETCNRFYWYFDTTTCVSSINEEQAKKFVACCNDNLSLCTVSRGIIAFRTVFKYAVQLGIISENPFLKVPCIRHVTNLSRQFYVERDMITKILSFCNDDRDRLIIVLGRYGGFRIPSEIEKLRFCDVTDMLIRIHEETKTGAREVPLFREIREVFERISGEPDELIFPGRYAKQWYAWSMLADTIERAGLERWEKLYVNLRSSCITDYENIGYSDKVMDAVFGNSAEVRKIHYHQLQKEKAYKKLLADNDLLNNRLQNGNNITLNTLNLNSYDNILDLRNFLVRDYLYSDVCRITSKYDEIRRK